MSEPNVPSIVAAPFVNAETLQPSASGHNRAIGQTEHHLLKVDDVEETVLDYQSTVKTGYYNHADYRLTLSKGVHTLTFTHDGENQSSINANLRVTASLDKMDLTYVTGQKNTVKKTAVVKFKKVSGAKGYQVYYSTSKNFKKNLKKVVTSKTSLKLTKLKKGTTYYVKVRAYKMNGKSKLYGNFSKTISVKIKK